MVSVPYGLNTDFVMELPYLSPGLNYELYADLCYETGDCMEMRPAKLRHYMVTFRILNGLSGRTDLQTTCCIVHLHINSSIMNSVS